MRFYISLTVVVVIVVVLVGLAIPATSRARDAAARIVCRNNLLQIAIACHNYADTYDHLPVGTSPLGNYPPESRLSWQVAVLPFTEHDNLYAMVDQEQSWNAPGNDLACGRLVKVYLCPRGMQWSAPGNLANTHYVGMAGVGIDAALLPKESLRAGVFGYDRMVRFDDITDRKKQ